MIKYNTGYFGNNCYFYLKEGIENFTLYYSTGETLNESKKDFEKKSFKKNDAKKVVDSLRKILKSKNKYTKDDIKKELTKKPSGEIDELVDSDGTMLSSRIPNLNQTLTPHKTLDQTVAMSRQAGNPILRGYRVYYGESVEDSDNVMSEVDYSDAFGYEETESMDYKNTVKTLKKMGVENPVERTNQFGKLPKQKVKKDKKGRRVLKQRLVEKEQIEEEQKQKMIKMVEDILTKKNKSDSDIISKNNPLSKILVKNIQSIKKIAEKEGISVSELIKILKSNE
jgi:hypothetical protein